MWQHFSGFGLSKRLSFGLLISVLLAGSTWFYLDQVLVPHQKQYAADHGIPRGNLSDLYPRWLGSRELLLHGRDPYSFEVTGEIQTGYYGRPLDPSRPGDPMDEERFAYPVYVAFLLAPTVQLPFSVVQPLFKWTLGALTIITVPLWLRFVGWRTSPALTAIFVVFVLGSFGAVQGIRLQQLTLLVAALIAAGAAALIQQRLTIAGFLFALATIKPQLVLPLMGWLLVWSCGNFRERWKLLLGFFITLAALLAASQYLLPGWLGRFAVAITAYRRYTGGAGSVLDVLASTGVGRTLAVLAIILVAVSGWRMRHASTASDAFRWLTALVLSTTVLVVPMTAPYNQLLLLPGVFYILSSSDRLWRSRGAVRVVFLAGAAMVLEPFLAAFALMLVSPIIPASTLLRFWAVPLYTSLAIPIVVFCLLLVGRPEWRAPSPA